MKKVYLLLLAASMSSSLTAQTPITISASDIPVNNTTDSLNMFPTSATLPVTGDDVTWDYSSFSGTVSTPNTYQTTTDATFSQSPIWYPTGRNISSNFGITYNQYLGNGSSYFGTNGYHYTEQRYSLQGITGVATDSFIIPDQKFNFAANPRVSLQYPVTAGSKWNSGHTIDLNFNLTVGAASLNNAPGLFKTIYSQFDSVVGWGKVILPTGNGPSVAYDVIFIKRFTTVTDSFFLNGSPAPTSLLTAFGVTQGNTNTSVRYIFWRKDSKQPLLIFNFNSTNTTTPSSVYYSSQLQPASASSVEENTLGATVYPIPATDNLSFKTDFTPGQYRILDLSGRVCDEGTVINGQSLSVKNLDSGSYMLELSNKTEKFTTRFIKQ